MKKLVLAFLSCALSTQLNAAIIIGADLTNLNGDISNVNWLENGLLVNQEATVTDSSNQGLFLYSNNDYLGVKHNIHQKGSWFLDISVTVSSIIDSIVLNELSFFAFAINGQGQEQQYQRDLDFSFEIFDGATSIFSMTNVIFEGDNQATPFDASKNTIFDLNGVSLIGGEDYTLRVTASGNGAGNNAALNGFTLSGTQVAANVSAPGVLSLSLLSVVLLMATRKRK